MSGGFSANFVPSGLDVLLQGFAQSAAQILEPGRLVNPLCNWYFMAASSVIIVLLGWGITDRIVEPRLAGTVVDGEEADSHTLERLDAKERRALFAAAVVAVFFALLVVAAAAPEGAVLRSPSGSLTDFDAPLMRAIVPLLFLFFLVTGLTYGAACPSLRPECRIGTMVGTMLPYSSTFILVWTALLLVGWGSDMPLGLGAG